MNADYRSFQRQVLPEPIKRNIGCIGMKSLGGSGAIATKTGVPVDQALGYAFSLPISTLASGIDSEKVLDQNLKVVREYSPMSESERHALETKYLKVAGDGRSSCSSRRRYSTVWFTRDSTASTRPYRMPESRSRGPDSSPASQLHFTSRRPTTPKRSSHLDVPSRKRAQRRCAGVPPAAGSRRHALHTAVPPSPPRSTLSLQTFKPDLLQPTSGSQAVGTPETRPRRGPAASRRP